MSDLENKNKAKFNFDPNTAKPIDTPLVAKVDGFSFDPSTAKEDQKGVLGHLKDTGASVMSGLAGVAEATTVGLANLYTEGRVGKDIDNTGYYKLGEAQKHWSDKKTDIAKEQEKTRQNTDGIWNKTKYVLENPSAGFSYGATKQEKYYGFRGYIVINLSGMITNHTFAPANYDERDVIQKLHKIFMAY